MKAISLDAPKQFKRVNIDVFPSYTRPKTGVTQAIVEIGD